MCMKKTLLLLFASMALVVSCRKEGIYPKSISLDKTELTIGINESEELTVIYEPADVRKKKVKWTSSDASVALVEDGVVYGIAPGPATVTARCGDAEAVCQVAARIDGRLLILNTVGGDIEAGLAIAELIAGMKKPTVSLVLGGGHSIGVPLAVAANRSFIVPSATMTIHPVRMTGLVLGVPQAFTYFQKMQARITRFVTEHSHISAQRFTELSLNTDELTTDVGTVLEGEEAVALGLIDEVGSLSAALAALNGLIEQQR